MKLDTNVDLQGLGRFAGMAGSSIAGRDAVGWVTHFLNAAYYGVPAERRALEDLRLAWAVLTTHWYRLGHGRLAARHVRRFHHSFRAARGPAGSRYPRGLLDRDQLQLGAARLLGDWFVDGTADVERLGWGVVFESAIDLAKYQPEVRLLAARLGPLTPPNAPSADQIWHTYEPVPVPSVEDLMAVLDATHMWSHYPTDVGRFTALRTGPLRGQTFEVEAIAQLARHAPMLTRGYVTVTEVLDPTGPDALEEKVAMLDANLQRSSNDEPALLPPGGRPTHIVELTTHAGHFLGRARNYLVSFEADAGAYLCVVGNWDPMPWYVRVSYVLEGADAQRAFWGFEGPQHSMLRQFARAAARRQRARGDSPRMPPELESDPLGRQDR